MPCYVEAFAGIHYCAAPFRVGFYWQPDYVDSWYTHTTSADCGWWIEDVWEPVQCAVWGDVIRRLESIKQRIAADKAKGGA